MRKIILAKVLLISTLFLIVTPAAIAAQLGDRVLTKGCRGQDVAQLQQVLNNKGFWSGYADGILGNKTVDALVKFQKAKGLKADGIAGFETFSALGVDTSYRGSSGRFSTRDVELLAKLVYAEARGEPYSGQVAVAATVLNRLNNPAYPKSIPEIIFQVVDGHYQYSPVLDGQINLVPDETARRAVVDALSGVDPTGGATTFYNPSKTSDQWVRNRSYVTAIGNHVFSK
ncbi:Cell wall hydrolase SleB [Tepidanaerobacter acetatoxydans Re1]|uniref:Cell wall hydrolase SleB n=1 Tax=Tepidanaerobacter acetatoxydans (strain DSM 21804 / JCM 16047 / Re1) TaxID=1209989 RepID=F4LT44_TEPAE|nr:cell wall hydrolase [Tepidanaerobacter acetatoxydans]AEE91313.1 cell wall hydrolase SleB [Tepidanaerobacter acetatoxydans Re1]CCP26001.1 Cell wall hydrolase SleB [Tepidanaerobacter acetatoxydans Re1]